MKVPILKGTIARRILVNFRADPDVVQALLPSPFRPKLHRGQAIVGICLLRLEKIRPVSCSLPVGLSSENAAHRMAVLWDESGETREGVFIPRRDTSSALNHVSGGRLFPGEHQFASFDIRATENNIDFQMRSRDGQVEVRVSGQPGTRLPPGSCFASLDESSAWFESGCLGFSACRDSDRLDGMLLQTKTWRVQTLDVASVYSSFFSDEKRFPKGSIQFDHALLMRNIEHEWHAAQAPASAQAPISA